MPKVAMMIVYRGEWRCQSGETTSDGMVPLASVINVSHSFGPDVVQRWIE
jgi:hypothetical protein